MAATLQTTELDPARYEVFLHRLWAIGEEGRLALQRVSASPIVVQGGECMSSFYDPSGTMILACSGHLRFAAATSQAIRNLFEWFSKSPGFFEGDQLFLNDPYIAGSHTYDQMVIMPIFHQGKLVAWTASSSHTADTGGVLRGVATEIYHEGIRVAGLKIVEKGEFREDVFKALVEQCRDPYYVGLDLKSRIAANNVCARRYLEMIERFGVDFCAAASQKIIEDSERLAREKLRSLPDGTWRSRTYYTVADREMGKVQPLRVMCEMRKEDDTLSFDFSGTSDQQHNDQNSTLPSTMAHLSVALTNQLFWDTPWSDGKMRPVQVHVPQRSLLNCEFPAACGFAPRVGQQLVAVVSECLAKMLYAAGRAKDVNATWQGRWYEGGPGYFFGGHDRRGIPNPQGIYDIHGAGLGAAPHRDGVDTGGHMNIPSGGISDVERIELQYPFLYFSRNHNTDGGGYGRWTGGLGSARLNTIYGSSDFTVDFKPYGGLPQGFGLFGGYPAGSGGVRSILRPARDLLERTQAYPTSAAEGIERGDLALHHPEGAPPRVGVPEGWLLSDFTPGGGGFGDPLLREPDLVARDVQQGRLSARIARDVFGVVAPGYEVGATATDQRRAELRQRRLESAPPSGRTSAEGVPDTDEDALILMVPHEYLEIVGSAEPGEAVVRCRSCKHVFCLASDNYKRYALRGTRQLQELAAGPLPSGEGYLGVYHEYYCPCCATQLEVDVYCPLLDDDTPVFDIQVRLDAPSW